MSEQSSMWAAFDDALEPDGFGVAGYEILGEIGRGSMGAIYHARQLKPSREVAVKVLLPKFGGDAEMRERFQTEARAMAALDHPGILPIYEVGESSGLPFFSMKLASGGSLAERLDGRPIPPKKAVDWVTQIAAALHHAHQHGVLHRDLKPGNFLFDDQGKIYVGDFGVAKILDSADPSLTRTTAFIGTPYYMPPEVASGTTNEATTSGDLYSLGAAFYECLTGHRPHPEKENIASLLRSIADESISPPRSHVAKIPLDLEVICLKALAKSPADRYPSVHAFSEDLARWQDGLPIRARPLPLHARIGRWAKRHPLPAALVAALIITTLTGGILLNRSYQKSQIRLHASLLDQARTARVNAAPGHREKVLSLLQQAKGIAPSEQIREEAVALFAQADVSPITTQSSQKIWSPPSQEDDPVTSTRSRYGELHLCSHRSGKVTLWRTDHDEPAKEWLPLPGEIVAADFLNRRSGMIITGVARENVGLDSSHFSVSHIEVPEQIRFLKVDPHDRFIILGGPDSIEVREIGALSTHWIKKGEAMRCSPAWSEDGWSLAAALGERKQVIVFDVESGAELQRQATSGWPQFLTFQPQGNFLSVVGSDQILTLLNLTSGNVLAQLDSPIAPAKFDLSGLTLSVSPDKSWLLKQPIGYLEWRGHIDPTSSATFFGGKLSPDGKFLLTITSMAVEIWSTNTGRKCGSYSVENQRIDARTNAWWLPGSPSEILVQVPGGLEKLRIDESGSFEYSKRTVPRLPGSSILAVQANGDWLAKVRDENFEVSFERWPQGDFEKATPISEPPLEQNLLHTWSLDGSQNAEVTDQGTIQISGSRQLTLTLPNRVRLAEILFTSAGNRLIAMSENHRIFEWDLEEIEGELQALGF